MKTKCPHCGVLTELGIDGKAIYAFVAPQPSNGTAFTLGFVEGVYRSPRITGPGISDYRGLITILKTVSINDVCPESGMTPLIWAIEHGTHIAFCFVHGANPSTRGTGDYDLSPLDLALQKVDDKLIGDLIRRGAEAPAELLNSLREKQAAKTKEFQTRSKFVKDTIKQFKRDSKSKEYQARVEHLESVFGVSSSVARGRGMQAFAKVPLRSLAAANNVDEIDYLASLHDESSATRLHALQRTVTRSQQDDPVTPRSRRFE